MKAFSVDTNFAIYSPPGTKEIVYIEGELASFNQQEGFIVTPFNGEKKIIVGDEQPLSDFEFKVESEIENAVLNQENYLKMVNAAIANLNEEFKKVVLSRIIARKTDYSIAELFKKLVDYYPNAFVSLINTSAHGTWIGASPEHLLAHDYKTGISMALAGTQKKKVAGNYEWSSKEVEEQSYVSNFVEGHLNALSIPFNKVNSTKETGNVAHICSVYTFNYSSNIALLPDLLHPTPAVCGTPTDIAKAEIVMLEPHKRNLYTGYFGPRTDKGAQLFVNLRCMQIGTNATHIFVGGGITKDSDAEKEWEETRLKSETLLLVIENL